MFFINNSENLNLYPIIIFKKKQYDGVAFLHQCPLQNTQKNDGSNRQEIKFRVADGPGLFWYHSHTGLSSVDGHFGPLVIRPPRETMTAETEGQGAAAAAALAKENPALGDIDKEFLVLFGDWYHSTSGALGFATGRCVLSLFLISAFFSLQKKNKSRAQNFSNFQI